MPETSSDLTPAETASKAIVLLTWVLDVFENTQPNDPAFRELFDDVCKAVVKFCRKRFVGALRGALRSDVDRAVALLAGLFKSNDRLPPDGRAQRELRVSRMLAGYLGQAAPVAVWSERAQRVLQAPNGGAKAAALTRVAEVLGLGDRTLRRRLARPRGGPPIAAPSLLRRFMITAGFDDETAEACAFLAAIMEADGFGNVQIMKHLSAIQQEWEEASPEPTSDPEPRTWRPLPRWFPLSDD